MLSLTLDSGKKVAIGHKDEKSPFEISNSEKNKLRLGFEAKTSSGDKTALLSIHREEVFNDSSPQASKKPGPNLNDHDTKSNQKGIQPTDKPLLDSFIRQLGIQGAETLDNLKSKLLNLEQSPNFSNFISYVRNGAFFKHWADHYTKQAQEMSKSLRLTA